MDYGFALPGSGPLATPQALTTLALGGEELGFSYIGVGDHVILPRDVRSKYPYTETGVWPSGQSGGWLEHLTVLSFLASQTSTVRLLTTVTILPYTWDETGYGWQGGEYRPGYLRPYVRSEA